MDVNTLLAIVFIGLFLLCVCCLVTSVVIVRQITGSGEVAPRKKIFVRPAKTTPELVGAPKLVSSTEPAPLAGPNGVTHFDATKVEQYKDLQDIDKSDLSAAVDKYLHGEGSGQEAIDAALTEAEK